MASNASESISTVGPSEQHAELRRKSGEWNVTCTYFMGDEADPIEVDGSETGEMLGELWCVSRFEADMLGTPLHGNASLGYDPKKGKYIGTWKDSAVPFLYTFEGEFDAESQVLEMTGENYDPVRRCTATYRSRMTFQGDDEHLLELMIDVPDGLPIKILNYSYRRR